MKMNRIAAAALAGTMLTAPVLAEDAAWTPPTVTQEEMDAVQLGERILMRGTEGDDVRLVQQRLYDLGYLTDKVDGKFGLQTQKAVRAFQRAHKLEKVDGKVGRPPLACISATTCLPCRRPRPARRLPRRRLPFRRQPLFLRLRRPRHRIWRTRRLRCGKPMSA